MSFNAYRDDPLDDGPNPGNETKVGLQADRETDGRAINSRPAPWKVGDRLGAFILEAELGSGSSAWVYRARDTSAFDKRLALKLLRPESPEKMLWNKLGFRRMIGVEHANLVRVDLIHQLGDYVGLAMEEVDGLTFSKARRQLLNLNPSVAYDGLLSMLRQLASGLAVMHSHGLIHRDMKPANMMIRHNGVAKIIDYGLVEQFKMNALDCTPRGRILGTPRYIAPEVLWSQQYIPSGDIFCLGVVCLETLRAIQKKAGLLLPDFERSDEDDEDQQRINGAIDDLRNAVPGYILDACQQMLSRHPADRPQAIELARLGEVDAVSVNLPLADSLVGREREMEQIIDWASTIFTGAIGRLHIRGPSGIGKTRLVDEVVAYIESKHWGQLFRAKCSPGEDQPMQTFDQLCDAIADRYMQGDRERMILDPVSATLLKEGFPVLANVLEASVKVAPPSSHTAESDGSAATKRMSEQLRKVGPLFLVIDDSQWADQDSRTTLDRLARANGDAGLGIITVSRGTESYRVPPDVTVELGPLGVDDSIKLIATSAERWEVDLSPELTRKLALAADGNPFRLREIANEFRPGRSLATAQDTTATTLLDHGSIDDLWHQRAAELSDDARATLPFVVTASGRMSTHQLGELTGLNDSIDAVVSELAQQRFIHDGATGGECIQIFHDRIADQWLGSIDQQVTQKAHHAWASHLTRQENPNLLAARIAGHFFAAGQPGQALSHAILAAEDAEKRSAKFEAARLYKRVSQHVEGTEKIAQLRNAAHCFRDGEHSIEAAECFRELANLLEEDEQIECQLVSAALLTRAGQLEGVRDQIAEIARKLKIPRPKSSVFALAAVIVRQLQLNAYGRGALLKKLTEESYICESQSIPMNQRTRQRLDLCFSLVRPLSMFDSTYGAELSLFGSRLLLHYRDTDLRIIAAVSEAVFGCYDNNRKRVDAENQLEQLESIAEKFGSARAKGDIKAGIAFSHGLAGRWNQVSEPAIQSISHYKDTDDSIGFEVAHTEWIHMWSLWHLGHWCNLRRKCFAIYDEAVARNDLFQQSVACNGYAVGAWLAADKVSTLEKIQQETYEAVEGTKRIQMIDVFNWAGLTLRKIYEGRFDPAWQDYQLIKPQLRKQPFSTLQMVRVMQNQLAALIALHQLNGRFTEPVVLRASLLIDQLRSENTPFAIMLANLYLGLLTQRIAMCQPGRVEKLRAISHLATARDQAHEQRLLPFELAATDALHGTETGIPSSQLLDRMAAEGINKPSQFQRTITVDFWQST